jgi:hypothetical protein
MLTSAKRIISKNPQFVNPLKSFPQGHRFFSDCLRETNARFIQWGMWSGHPKPDVWFVTLTFKTFIESWKSWVLLKRWLGHLRQGYEDKGGLQLRWICATEWQIRHVVHFHLLISGVGLRELSRKRWEVRWESGDRNAGFCRIYDAERNLAPYLAKYLDKGGELSRGGFWRGLKTPESVSCCRPGLSVIQSGESQEISQATR